MAIVEPMTLATDYVLAGLTCWWGVRLLRQGLVSNSRAVRCWGLAFLLSALAAVVGGSVHGFAPQLGPELSRILWKLTVYAIGLADFTLLLAVLLATTTGPWRRLGILLATAKLLFYGTWMIRHDQFRYVIMDYAPSLLLVLLLQLPGWRRREPAAAWIAGGVLLSFVAAGIQFSGFALHRNFNHNDLYHVVQMGAFWLLFRGGSLWRDR